MAGSQLQHKVAAIVAGFLEEMGLVKQLAEDIFVRCECYWLCISCCHTSSASTLIGLSGAELDNNFEFL